MIGVVVGNERTAKGCSRKPGCRSIVAANRIFQNRRRSRQFHWSRFCPCSISLLLFARLDQALIGLGTEKQTGKYHGQMQLPRFDTIKRGNAPQTPRYCSDLTISLSPHLFIAANDGMRIKRPVAVQQVQADILTSSPLRSLAEYFSMTNRICPNELITRRG